MICEGNYMIFYVDVLEFLLILVSFFGWGKVLVLETLALFAWGVICRTELDLTLHIWLHDLGRKKLLSVSYSVNGYLNLTYQCSIII